jgi:hypothetical protein
MPLDFAEIRVDFLAALKENPIVVWSVCGFLGIGIAQVRRVIFKFLIYLAN